MASLAACASRCALPPLVCCPCPPAVPPARRGLSLNPFEFRVLEHSLSSVCHKYQKRISFVTPITRRLLRGLGATGSVPDELQLHRMFPLRESIRAFDDATADMLREMENLMQEDSELARLCLTYRFHKRRDLALGQALPSEDEDRRRRMWVGEVEMLLQTYYARIVSINRTLVGLRRSIAGAHEMMYVITRHTPSLLIIIIIIIIITMQCACLGAPFVTVL